MPKEAAPEAKPAAKEASIPRSREESNAASEGGGTRPAVRLRGSLTASGVLSVPRSRYPASYHEDTGGGGEGEGDMVMCSV